MNTEEQPPTDLEVAAAINAGMTVILASLIATHPDYENFQIHLAGLLEVAAAGSLFSNLTHQQQQLAREYVERLQRIQEAPAASQMLRSALRKIASKPPSA